jgi:protein TonB
MATSLGRGMTSGYFSSFAEGKNLRDDIREYYFMLLEKINTKWWLKAETLKETASNDGVALFVIARDGTLIELKLTKSTGSREVDIAIIEVLKDMAPFPALPANYTPDKFLAPLRIAAPLHLFSVKSLR